MNKQMETFSFSPPMNSVEEEKAVTCFEATNSVFIETDENNSFSIVTLEHGYSDDNKELIPELNKLLEL